MNRCGKRGFYPLLLREYSPQGKNQKRTGKKQNKRKEKMKRIITALMMMITIPSFATTMCAVDNSVVVVLDPTVAGTAGGTYDATAGLWNATFPYGMIYGISACLNTGQGKSMGYYESQLTDTNNGETNLVQGSEKYGRYCWCKMTHPVASLWVFNGDYGSAASCASSCTYYCGYYARYVEAMRVGLFGSVAQ